LPFHAQLHRTQALELYDTVRLDLLRPEGSRVVTKSALNFIFAGNPGTGKTTVARIFGRLLEALGVRAGGGAFVEGTGQDMLTDGSGKFKAKYLAPATPGTLFVDEVYQLDPVGNGEGRAITNLVMRAAEDDRDKLTVIVAGYEDDIRNKWLASNEGLRSRFPRDVTFDDFSEDELRSVFMGVVRGKGWKLERVPRPAGGGGGSAGAAAAPPRVDLATIAARRLAKRAGRKGFGNARAVRVMVEQAISRANSRIMSARAAAPPRAPDAPPAPPDDALVTLTRADVLGAPVDARSSPAMQELARLPGLGAVKASLEGLIALVRSNFDLEMAGRPPLEVSLHRLFLGNPGTGKTSVAKLYGRVLKELGLLSNGEVVVVGASKLVGDVVGSAQKAVNTLLDSAAGKVRSARTKAKEVAGVVGWLLAAASPAAVPCRAETLNRHTHKYCPPNSPPLCRCL
jgi:DNA polymerase III delta prime subunit